MTRRTSASRHEREGMSVAMKQPQPRTAPPAARRAPRPAAKRAANRSHDHRLGHQIRDLRRAKGVTIPELARRIERSVGWVSQIERGLSEVTIAALHQIAEALGAGVVVLRPGRGTAGRRDRPRAAQAQPTHARLPRLRRARGDPQPQPQRPVAAGGDDVRARRQHRRPRPRAARRGGGPGHQRHARAARGGQDVAAGGRRQLRLHAQGPAPLPQPRQDPGARAVGHHAAVVLRMLAR
ncbi:MAG: helix-turn-helix transcriptional regulator [Rubrivivax sp.]